MYTVSGDFKMHFSLSIGEGIGPESFSARCNQQSYTHVYSYNCKNYCSAALRHRWLVRCPMPCVQIEGSCIGWIDTYLLHFNINQMRYIFVIEIQIRIIKIGTQSTKIFWHRLLALISSKLTMFTFSRLKVSRLFLISLCLTATFNMLAILRACCQHVIFT